MSVNIDENSKIPSYDSFNILGNYKLPFIILLIVIILVYIFLFSLLNTATVDNPSSKIWVLVLEIILVVVLIVIIALNVKLLNDKQYSFTAELKNLFDKTTKIEIGIDGDIPEKKCDNTTDISGEVFNIPTNTYTYDEARAVCESLDSRLATLDELEDAYKNGANWCSYGWSEDQLALFPIQKSVYNDLKKTKSHAHDCGRPGINGGYFPNKSTKFGVNCYGKKPYQTDKNKNYQKSINYSPAYPDLKEDEVEEHVNDILIAPFNKNDWND